MNQGALEVSVLLEDEAATLDLGGRLGAALEPGIYIALSGDLGSGKTTLARGMLRGLGYEGKVKSPTYTLVELYKLSRLDLYHFDFYRFKDSHEMLEAGFRDCFDGHNVCVAEWPERAQDVLPKPDLDILMSQEGDGRRARIIAETEHGKSCLARLNL
jgi:tRNA threonylcarbamoyladenosine biosynthesis protein TsaE